MRTFIASLAAAVVSAGKYEALYSHYMSTRLGGKKENLTPITVNVDGVETTKYILSDTCTGQGGVFGCPEGGRAYIVNGPSWDPKKPDYWHVDLIGDGYGTLIEWDVDLSDHGCGCINAFYTVSMPGKNSQGDFEPSTDGYYYCDANQVGGTYCPEYDLMEANKYAYQTTPHSCDAPDEKGYYSKCDRGGYAKSTADSFMPVTDFGPGEDHQIDTNKPFHVVLDFYNWTDMKLGMALTTLVQGDNKVTLINDDYDYLKNIAGDMTSQVFVFSNWKGDDSWLRKDRCSGSCYNDPDQKISNLKITYFHPQDYKEFAHRQPRKQ